MKKAGDEIYLMKSIFCPAVLVECGFLSNPEELEKLKNEEYRDSLALVIAAAVSEFASIGSMRG